MAGNVASRINQLALIASVVLFAAIGLLWWSDRTRVWEEPRWDRARFVLLAAPDTAAARALVVALHPGCSHCSERLAQLAPSLTWPANVWIGVSVETDRYAFRANDLRTVGAAAVRFLSVEPLVGPVPSLDFAGMNWVIVGGESGHGARPLDLKWVEDVRDRSVQAGASFFLKQLGSVWARENGMRGKAHAMAEWPADLRVRDMPERTVAPIGDLVA